MKVLLIDDCRDDEQATHIARTYDDGVQQLKNETWDVLILDHDLGCFKNGKEYTGYDIALWLLENIQFAPKEIYCCSSNPVGRKKIIQVIEEIKEK